MQRKHAMQKTHTYIDNEIVLLKLLETAKKIRDKGGCVVVEGSNGAVITTYNYSSKTKH